MFGVTNPKRNPRANFLVKCQAKFKRSRILTLTCILQYVLRAFSFEVDMHAYHEAICPMIWGQMFSWIHPQDLSWVYVFCWGMLMQGKHTLCVPPLWLTVKDIENTEDPGVNIMTKTPKP